jgi:2'-5' RNA ligase
VIRAFVGIRIDPNMAQGIAEVQSQLKGSLSGIRWVGNDKLHLTLKFLGEVQEDKVEPIIETLEGALRDISQFSIFGRGIGVFPDIRRARILWVGLEAKPLASIATGVESVLEPIGFPRERRSFKPHLTIGRWRNFDGSSDRLKQEIERFKNYDFGEARVEEVVLFQSVLKPEGAVYSPLKVFALKHQRLSN